MLSHGCAGGVFGTRFLLTPESQYSDLQKDLLVRSNFGHTKRTLALDDARGTRGWPAGVDGRGISNLTVDEYERDMEMEKTQSDKVKEGMARRMERYKQAASEADVERIVVWSGTGVGGMDRIVPADEVVREITQQAVEAIQEAHSCCGVRPDASGL